MTRGGRDKDREDPERKCIVTGEAQPKAGLIRFVIGPENQVVPDLAEKLPGRGIWVSADRETLAQAVKKNAFSRAAKGPVTLPDDLVQVVEDGMARRLIELVSLARKAGLAICGFEKVKDWLAKGHAKVLLQSTDGSERGKGKLWTPTGVIHGALAAGGLTTRVVEDAARLAGLRKQDGGATAGKD